MKPGRARRIVPRAERMRALRSAATVGARVLAAALASAAVAFAVRAGWLWATEAEALAIRSIRFQGLRHAEETDLTSRSGLRVGQNILAADLAAAARGISAHPWVFSARLSRSFPDEVRVDVREREAAALVHLGVLYATDASGRVFKRATAADALDLPLVTGVDRVDWLEMRGAAERRLDLALQLVAVWRALGLPPRQLSEVRVDADGGLTIFANDGGEVQEVRIGAVEVKKRLQRLARVRAALARRGERAVRIDLDLVKAGKPWATAQLAGKGR